MRGRESFAKLIVNETNELKTTASVESYTPAFVAEEEHEYKIRTHGWLPDVQA